MHHNLIRQLDQVVHQPDVLMELLRLLAEASTQLAEDRDQSRTWFTIPVDLSIYGDLLPAEIKSSRVTIFRAGHSGKVESHPNSDQYVCVLQESSDIQTLENDVWVSHLKRSGLNVPLDDRWSYVPQGVWHRPVAVGEYDWGVVGFHTVESDELVDERR